MQRRTFLMATTACTTTLAVPMLGAQTNLPAGPVRILVGFSPGGGTDILARVIGQKLSTLWNTEDRNFKRCFPGPWPGCVVGPAKSRCASAWFGIYPEAGDVGEASMDRGQWR